MLPADETKSITPGPIQAVQMSVQENVKTAGLIFQTLWGLITRETSPKQLMGPSPSRSSPVNRRSSDGLRCSVCWPPSASTWDS